MKGGMRERSCVVRAKTNTQERDATVSLSLAFFLSACILTMWRSKNGVMVAARLNFAARDGDDGDGEAMFECLVWGTVCYTEKSCRRV